MARYKNVNGVRIQFTAEEEAARDAEEEQAVINNQAEADAKTAKDNLKSSAKAKLIAGEALTEDEADTVVI
jgi:hypothetical protein